MTGLKDLKRQMDEENYDKDAFSFTKIILKLGTIEKVLRRVKVRRGFYCRCILEGRKYDTEYRYHAGRFSLVVNQLP